MGVASKVSFMPFISVKPLNLHQTLAFHSSKVSILIGGPIFLNLGDMMLSSQEARQPVKKQPLHFSQT